VREAFIAAEDKRFYQHHGVDEHGLIRAFIGNLAHSGRPQGGSTITQQVVKNLLVGEDVSYERKIREMIVAARLETTLTKDEILQLYLNCVYLGRGAWGVEVAARSYFGKPAKDLTLNEGALLAGLTKGPTYFSPDRAPNLTRERLAYVLNRMREDGMSGWVSHAEAPGSGSPSLPVIVASARSRRDIGFHFRQSKLKSRVFLAFYGLYPRLNPRSSWASYGQKSLPFQARARAPWSLMQSNSDCPCLPSRSVRRCWEAGSALRFPPPTRLGGLPLIRPTASAAVIAD
jgi:hypothetical protein